MTKTETMVRTLAKATWSDATVNINRSGDGPACVVIYGTEPPLRGAAVQVDEYGETEAAAWRRALTKVRHLAKHRANAEAKRAESLRAQATRHDAHAAAITAALNGGGA